MTRILNLLSSKSEGLLSFISKLGVQPILATLLTLPVLFCSLRFGSSGYSGLALIPIAFILFSMRTASSGLLTGDEKSPLVIGTFFVPRVLILLSLTLFAVREDSAPWTLVSISVVALAMSCETPIRNIGDRIQPIAVQLPGNRFLNHPRIASASVPLTSLIWTVIFAVAIIWFPTNPALIAGSAVLLMLHTLLVLLHYTAVYFKQQGQGKRLSAALKEYQPKFILHWDAPARTTYQVKMWLPYLERAGVPFVVLVRSQVNFEEAQSLTSRPIILRKTITSLDSVIVGSVRAVLYVNTATVNNHMVRYTHLTHIQLNHGESDKVASFNPAFRVFTKNFVSGQAAIDRFAKNGVSTAPDFFEIVGRPQIENIQVASLEASEGGTKSILYAPTWHGFYEDSNYSSLSIGRALVEEIHKAGHRVIFRPHPYSFRSAQYRQHISEIQNYLAGMNSSQGSSHKFGKEAEQAEIIDLMNESNALISDVSSVVSDYLFSEKPFSVVCINQNLDALHTSMPLSNAAYVLESAIGSQTNDSFTGSIQAVLAGFFAHDSLRTSRTEFKKYYLGDIPYEERTTTFITKLNQFL